MFGRTPVLRSARVWTIGTVLYLFSFARTVVHCDSVVSAKDFAYFLRECCTEHVEEDAKCEASLNFSRNVLEDFQRTNESTTICCATCLGNMESNQTKEGSYNSTRSCIRDCFTNKSAILMTIEDRPLNTTDGQINGNATIDAKPTHHCGSIFSTIRLWGASIVIFANMIYIIPYLIVVFVYLVVPGLRARAYDKAVICYNISQIFLNAILIGLGATVLCHASIPRAIFPPMGLSIMFLTISSTFWLFVICFDMTLAITRFRWAPPSDANRQQENKKFFMYATFTWGCTFVPTLFAGIAELAPFLPESSPIRPNFYKFDEGPNLAVIIYVTTLPLLMCITNSALFCYTTYKMIQIRKSTAMASVNSTANKKAKKTYYVFLRLYLLMDAPWVTSALGAVFTDLWILKFLRMIQPILMLFAILPRQTVASAFSLSLWKSRCRCNSRSN